MERKEVDSDGMSTMSEELDQAVLDWLQEERAAGRVDRNSDLQKKALQVAQLFKNVPAGLQGKLNVDKIRWTMEGKTQCWLSKWNKQFLEMPIGLPLPNLTIPLSMCQLTTQTQLEPISGHKHGLDHVCMFDMVPHATSYIPRERHICITHTKANKKGLTIALTSHGNGGKLQKTDDIEIKQ